MNIITSRDITNLLTDMSLTAFFTKAFAYVEEDLSNWQEFQKSPRHAVHADHGVFELMPSANNDYYGYKYVNGHPGNPALGKQSIVATGMLADVATGYPKLFCDMTLLTAIRTATMSALAAKHLAPKHASTLGLIGTGAQAEFQVQAMRTVRNITTVRYFDRDESAMQKFANNMVDSGLELVACASGAEAVQGADIITTCICEKSQVKLFSVNDLDTKAEIFINAIGGDCPGKTELDVEVVKRSKIVVEYFEQTKIEGEIQQLENPDVYAELWEIIQGKKAGRTDEDTWILFDSVGFAVADFSMLRLLHDLELGNTAEILPELANPKNLYSLVA